MSIEAGPGINTTVVICDTCGASIEYDTVSAARAASFAEAEEWSLESNEQAMCPKCINSALRLLAALFDRSTESRPPPVKRALVAAAVAAATLTATSDVTDAAPPPCAELAFIYAGNFAVGGEAWCAGRTWWQVVVGCAATRYGAVYVTAVGPRATRYESVAHCPSKYPYARWVSAYQGAAK